MFYFNTYTMKNITYIIAGTLLVLITACSSLDQYPLNGPSSDTYLTNESELKEALYEIYDANSYEGPNSTRMAHNIVLDALSDIGFERNSSGIPAFVLGNANPNNTYSRDMWKAAYVVVSRCNYLLTNMHRAENNVNPKTYAEIAAQARVLRAYTYLTLTELWGDVPLITTMSDLSEAIVPRTPKSEVCDFILKELDEAAAILPDDYSGTGHVSASTALALKARAALYNKRWDVAAQAAKAVMDMGVHELHNDFEELFMYAGAGSKEIIWSFQYLKSAKKVHGTCRNFGSRNGQGHSNKVPSQSLVDAYQCTDGKDIDKSPLYNPKKPFENRDPRMAYTLALPGSIFMGYQFETHKDSVNCWNYRGATPVRVKNEEATNAYASFTGYCWRKYVDPLDFANPVESELNQIAIRYAEVLLIYAEAKIEANQIDQSVYNAINQVRGRPTVNMPPLPSGLNQAQLRSAVRKERLYEFAGEGLRLFDIRRWRIAEYAINGPFYGRIPKGLLQSAPAIDENGIPDYSNVPNKDEMRVVEVRKFVKDDDRDYLWPIPEREMSANPALVQNPGF